MDPHQHFWSLSDPWFEWPTPELASIYQDVGPKDLSPLLRASGVDETVLVQVAPRIAETDHLLDIAHRTEFVSGVVGWVNLDESTSIGDLERLAARPKFVGIRPMN